MRDHHKDEPHISTIPPKTAAGGVLIKVALVLKVTSSASVKSLLGVNVAGRDEVLGRGLAQAATMVLSARRSGRLGRRFWGLTRDDFPDFGDVLF